MLEDPKEYEEDGAEEDKGADGAEGVGGGEGGGGRERRGGGRFNIHSLIKFLDKFKPSLMKRKKKSKGHA